MPVAPGVTYVHRTTSKPLHIHMLRIDLLHPRVGFRTAIANDVVYGSPERTSSLAARKGAIAAVNADYFGAGHHNCEELLYTDGRLIYAPPEPFRSILNISRDNAIQIGMNRQGVPFYNTVGGGPHLLRNGRFVWDKTVPDRINGEGFTPNTKFDAATNPWTAVGVTRDGAALILAVVDGRQPSYSVGVGPAEMASILSGEGAYQGMKFDGGGSSTLWLRDGGVVNSPSDGSERAVGTALLIYTEGGPRFLRGDVTGDGILGIDDAVVVLLYVFRHRDSMPCLDAADADDSESIGAADALRILHGIFSGVPPAPPYPDCGEDPSGTRLGCAEEPFRCW